VEFPNGIRFVAAALSVVSREAKELFLFWPLVQVSSANSANARWIRALLESTPRAGGFQQNRFTTN
jgi:hypothetical protein